MTTAARPTWAPAKGGHEQGGVRMFGPSQKFSSRDLASHTTLKLRFAFPHFASHASWSMSVCESPFCMGVCVFGGDGEGRACVVFMELSAFGVGWRDYVILPRE
jgi:hypothetical protein